MGCSRSEADNFLRTGLQLASCSVLSLRHSGGEADVYRVLLSCAILGLQGTRLRANFDEEKRNVKSRRVWSWGYRSAPPGGFFSSSIFLGRFNPCSTMAISDVLLVDRLCEGYGAWLILSIRWVRTLLFPVHSFFRDALRVLAEELPMPEAAHRGRRWSCGWCFSLSLGIGSVGSCSRHGRSSGCRDEVVALQ